MIRSCHSITWHLYCVLSLVTLSNMPRLLKGHNPFFPRLFEIFGKKASGLSKAYLETLPEFPEPLCSNDLLSWFDFFLFTSKHPENHPKQYITNWPEQRNTNTYMTVICLSNPSFLELYINESIGTSAASSFSLLSVHLVFWLPNFSFPAIFLKPSVYFLDYNQNKVW